MQTIRVNSVSEYIKELETLGIEDYIYRGQNEPYFGIKANGFRPYMGVGLLTRYITSMKSLKNIMNKLFPN